jgi:hypothetical protein
MQDDEDDSATMNSIVLLPDSLTSESCDTFDQTSTTAELVRQFLLHNKKLLGVARDNTGAGINHGTVQIVFYSWLIDSICADMVAPVSNYSIEGIL